MTVMCNMTAKNTLTLAQLKASAIELGEQAGKGKDTQIKFFMKLVEGGYHNTIDLEPSKHGPEIDDVTMLSELYVKSQGSATVFDAKAPNQRKLVSCGRAGVKLGQWPKGGAGEPLGTLNSLISMRQDLRKDPILRKKLDDAYNVGLKFARTQVKRDHLIEDAELRTFCFKPEAPHKTPEQIMVAIIKELELLRDGKASAGTAHDNSPLVVGAIKSLKDRTKEIAAKRAAAQAGNKTPAGGEIVQPVV